MKAHEIEENFRAVLIDLASFGTDYPLGYDFVKLETEIKNHIASRTLVDLVESGNKEDLRLNEIYDNADALNRLFLEKILCFENQLWAEENGNLELKMRDFALDSDINTCSVDPWNCEDEQLHPPMKRILRLFMFVKEIRKCAFSCAKHNAKDARILYAQQLFFYSLRTLSYPKMFHQYLWRKGTYRDKEKKKIVGAKPFTDEDDLVESQKWKIAKKVARNWAFLAAAVAAHNMDPR